MDINEIASNVRVFNHFFQLILVFLISIIVFIRIGKQKKETGQINYIRVYILAVFLSFLWICFWEFMFWEANIDGFISEELYGSSSFTFSLYNIGLALIGTFSLSMVLYANQMEAFYFMPFFIFGGMVIFFMVTGLAPWLMFYVYFSSFVGLVFLYQTAFRFKDDGSLGLAIFFTIAFSTLFVKYIPNIADIGPFFVIVYCTFGVYFTLGYFHPFNTEEVN